jgi:hypothetical protein
MEPQDLPQEYDSLGRRRRVLLKPPALPGLVDEQEWARLRGKSLRHVKRERLGGYGAPYILDGISVRYWLPYAQEWLLRKQIDPGKPKKPRQTRRRCKA